MDEKENKEPEKKSGYGKRPLWQWIILYLIIGGLIYFVAYKLFFQNKYSYNSGNTGNSNSQYAP